MILALGGVVIGIGNWYVHAKNLQTKADAGALAGGNAWSFPCNGGTDTTIINQALKYAGPSASPNTSTGVNPQVGGVPSSMIHTVLNGDNWYDDDGNPAPSQWNSPPSNPAGDSGALCNSKILDVKMTEDNSFPLASLIPLFPDIKRKARVRIEEGSGFSGLLPIAVRVPKPLSAAAIYVDETPGLNYGHILSARYFKDICEATTTPAYNDCNGSIPNGLDQWISDDAAPLAPGNGAVHNEADISSMPPQTGVVIALSFRPACPGASPCFNITSSTDIDTLCNQGTGAGTAQCYYTTTSGGNEVFESGLQYIRRYSAPTSDNAPELGSVWLDTITPANCTHGYFSAVTNSCFANLNANVDIGGQPGFPSLPSSDIEIRYKMVSGGTSPQQDDPPGACDNNYQPACTLTGGSAPVEFVPAYARHAFAIRVRLQNVPNPATWGLPAACSTGFSSNCQWFFTGAGRSTNVPTNQEIFDNPVQRAFMGNLDRSGPVKYFHLYNVDCLDGTTVLAGVGVTGQAASVQDGRRCFQIDLGLQGALARDQDEYPIQLNIGATSQSAIVDCDPNIPNLKDEIVQGCQWPNYARHDFATTPYCPNVSGATQFFSVPKPAPWENWGANNGAGPFTCVLTQATATPNQVVQGFNERFFGDPTNPSCPADNAEFVKGRNYWHDYNNEYVADPDGSGTEPAQADYWTFATTHARLVLPHGNHLRNDDPRLVLLFITPYNSFTGNGNETYPISLIGGFYITGYGHVLGNGTLINDDPCSNGAVGGGTSPTSPYAGNTPPPDVDTSTASAIAWGHFIVPVDLGTSTGGTGFVCQGASTTACVAVLVE